MDDELRVLPQGPDPAAPSRAEDLPLRAAALAVLVVGEEAGQEDATDELVRAGLGGVVFFGSALADPAAAARRAANLQSAALAGPTGAPLLLGADQEGGRVRRLPDGPTSLPGAMALGAAGRPDLARQAGRATAGQLRAIGLQWNLAPVCDLWHPDGVLGSRCFGADPEAAGALAAAFAAGLQDGSVLACAKHFPGHAATAQDRARTLPVLSSLAPEALRPFAAAAAAGVGTLMLGHLMVPSLDPALPASLSAAFHRLARECLGPQGLLVTDSLSMAGALAAAGGDVGEAAVLALLAGTDLVLIGHGPPAHRAAWAAIVAAVAAGRLPEGRLAAAVTAVLRRKRDLVRLSSPDPEAAAHLLARPSDARLAAEIAAAAVTPLRDGPPVPRPAQISHGPATPPALVRAAAARWPSAALDPRGHGPWLTLDGRCHLLIGLPLPAGLPAGRVLLGYDAVPASLAALLAAAAGEAAAPGRLPAR